MQFGIDQSKVIRRRQEIENTAPQLNETMAT